MTNSSLTKVSVDAQEVHELSVELMHFLEESHAEVGTGIFALAMTLGRLVAPRILQEDEELEFIQNLMEYSGLYFTPTGKALN